MSQRNGSHSPEDERIALLIDKLGHTLGLIAKKELGHAGCILCDGVDMIEMILGL
jgi:hypothetical protein